MNKQWEIQGKRHFKSFFCCSGEIFCSEIWIHSRTLSCPLSDFNSLFIKSIYICSRCLMSLKVASKINQHYPTSYKASFFFTISNVPINLRYFLIVQASILAHKNSLSLKPIFIYFQIYSLSTFPNCPLCFPLNPLLIPLPKAFHCFLSTILRSVDYFTEILPSGFLAVLLAYFLCQPLGLCTFPLGPSLLIFLDPSLP